MKWQPAILLLLLTFTVSCKKETPAVNGTPKINNPTDYLLVSQTWTGPTTNGQSCYLTYNDDNLVSEIKYIQWWGGSFANGDTAYSYIKYSKGLCQKVIYTDHSGTGSTVYQYNNRGLPVEANLYNGNTYYKTHRYAYDSADRLVRVTDSSWRLNFIYEYTYDEQGNLASETMRSFADSTKTRTDWTSYDNQVCYSITVNGLPAGFLYAPFNSNFAFMQHNVLTSTYAFEGFPNSAESPVSFKYEYLYNEQGLPIQITFGSWIITNVYKKYK